MLMWKKGALVALTAIGLAVGVPATSNANLIQNGGFENTTPVVGSSTTGQLDSYLTADNWVGGGPGTSFNFLFQPATATTTGAPSQVGAMILWNATASPNGGNFVGGDGDVPSSGPLAVGPITQTVSGLSTGGVYSLGFFWAASQQTDHYGSTIQSWHVTVTPVGGGSPDATYDTTPYSLPGATLTDHSFANTFSGWMPASFTFTASSANEVISFLPVGDKPVPPIVLLDGVTLSSVPEPSSILGSVLLFSMFGAVWAFKRAKQPAVVA
jgi:hypothetical protein